MVLNGIDRIEEYDSLFRGKRLGLITSPTGLNRTGETTISILHKKYGLSALFSPEHGVRGNMAAGALVDTYIDEETGIPVYSLYRKDSKRLTPEMLEKVDVVVYDIQDVGTRYYTFISTMLYALQDCAKANKTLVVLDRPDPLDGLTVEGNVLREEYRSFVGAFPLCMRYGLTGGELALMAADRQKLDCDLHVIPCTGWNRGMQFPDYGTVWVAPSLNLPTFETTLLYPGMCLFEGTAYSEGRGTAAPFATVGAPTVNAPVLAREMNAKRLPGVWFRPIYFTPTTSKHKGVFCPGVQVHVTDRRQVQSVDVGIRLLLECRHEDPEFQFRAPLAVGARRPIEFLSGDHFIGDKIGSADELLAAYHAESAAFHDQVRQYFLYE